MDTIIENCIFQNRFPSGSSINLYVDEFILRKEITKNANLFHRSSNITFVLLKSMVISTSGYNQFTKIYSTCVQHSMYKYDN